MSIWGVNRRLAWTAIRGLLLLAAASFVVAFYCFARAFLG